MDERAPEAHPAEHGVAVVSGLVLVSWSAVSVGSEISADAETWRAGFGVVGKTVQEFIRELLNGLAAHCCSIPAVNCFCGISS